MKKIFTTISFILCIYSCSAQWNQIGSDINGEKQLDESGSSVNLSSDGSVVAIGAPRNDGNGKNAGHVRMYKNNNGSWIQIGSDIDGEEAGDYSGRSVSINEDGSIVAIGAHGNDGNGSDAGHVRVYKKKNGNWTQIGTDIDGETAGDQSGSSVSLSADGNIIAIGAPHNSGYPYSSRKGQVRVYINENGTWTQIGADIDGEKSGDLSGSSVNLSADGKVVAIGAPINRGNTLYSVLGHVRVYRNHNGSWTQIGTDIDGEAAGDKSGSSVSLSSDGNIVAIGANYNDDSATDAGHVRVYKNNNGNWTQVGLDIDGDAAYDFSGCAVSLSSDGSRVAIGAWGNDSENTSAGHVKIYKNDSDVWTQVESDISGEAAANYSGSALSLSADGTTIAIGAWGNDENGNNSGHLRLYSDNAETNSVNLNKFNSISVYPNPTSRIVTVHAENMKSFVVRNLIGALIIRELDIIDDIKTIDLSRELRGIYIISVKTETENIIQKIILE